MDFANGYLLGELLDRFHQQLDFKDFDDSYHQGAKVKNF